MYVVKKAPTNTASARQIQVCSGKFPSPHVVGAGRGLSNKKDNGDK